MVNKNNLKKFIKKVLKESFIEEDYPSSFDMEHFKSLKSFAQRIAYCQQHLQRLSSGSSRVVYKIDDEKVLKLAKNTKGIAQNETEIDRGSDTYFSNILARVFDSHPDAHWVEMELARKINPSQFRMLTTFDINDVKRYLVNFQEENSGKKNIFHLQKPLEDRLDADEFIQNLREFVAGTDALAGDLGQASSYGLVHRDGEDTLVLIDFGITQDIYKSHYSESLEEAEGDKESNLNDNFWNWFAGSKVADAKGNPIPVHHGTAKKFSKFSFKNAAQKIIWFTSNKSAIEAGEVGAAGSGHIMDLYVSMKNPAGWNEYQKYGLGQLESLGYDGAILPDPDGTFTGFVFEPSQLKSVENKGEWNPGNKNIFKEELNNSEEYKKSYRFYLLCDKLCDIEGVEVKNKMIADASPISRETFEKNCAYANELFEYEGQMADDPSHGFYKSNIKGVSCLYMQYAGFEFIFLKGYKGGKEYWLDNLNEVELNEGPIWNQGGILLLKGAPLADGKQRLFATSVKNLIEIKPGNKGSIGPLGSPGMPATNAVKMAVLGDDFFRLKYDAEGNLKAFRVAWKSEPSLAKMLNFKNHKLSVVLNNKKTPLHWESLQYNNIGVMVNKIGSQILRVDNVNFLG